MQDHNHNDLSEWKRKQMTANGRELLAVMHLAKFEFTRLQRHSAREIARTDLRFSLGIAAKRILNLVRDRKRIRAWAAHQPVVIFVAIVPMDDDSLYNFGLRDTATTSAGQQDHCAELGDRISELERQVQYTEKRIYSNSLINSTSHLHNFVILNSFHRALDALQKDLWSTAAAPESSFVVCDSTDCAQCAYREDQCVKEKAEREQDLQTLREQYEEH